MKTVVVEESEKEQPEVTAAATLAADKADRADEAAVEASEESQEANQAAQESTQAARASEVAATQAQEANQEVDHKISSLTSAVEGLTSLVQTVTMRLDTLAGAWEDEIRLSKEHREESKATMELLQDQIGTIDQAASDITTATAALVKLRGADEKAAE